MSKKIIKINSLIVILTSIIIFGFIALDTFKELINDSGTWNDLADGLSLLVFISTLLYITINIYAGLSQIKYVNKKGNHQTCVIFTIISITITLLVIKMLMGEYTPYITIFILCICVLFPLLVNFIILILQKYEQQKNCIL